MLTKTPLQTSTPLRDNITKAFRMDEASCVNSLLTEVNFSDQLVSDIVSKAENIIIETRKNKKKQSKIDNLLHQYDLSTEEGISLMCLAEALLRIPDKATMDRFISDKLSNANWMNHLSKDNSLFINAATWSLLLTGKIFSPALDNHQSLWSALTRSSSRLGSAVIRPIILQMMKTIGKQFVMGENIDSALDRAKAYEEKGYRYSYDMLGEAARTADDATFYYDAYSRAIDAIGKVATKDSPITNPGISVKLSALSPRYEFMQHERVVEEVSPLLLALAQQARKYNIGFNVDAEEADRLDLSLDIIEKVFSDPSLDNWDGFGLALQAYQKRATYVIDWLADLSKKHGKKIMVRLVKGAYWDAEIKNSQVLGLEDYPVFTRKNATDVSYLACAKKLFAHKDCFYPQFATHNAYSIAAIMEMSHDQAFEFQCLHGMGQSIYDHIVSQEGYNKPCRIYAPVGSHKDLLGYLVRRLLENGANSSFVNHLYNESIPASKLAFDPAARIAALESIPHPRIPLPRNIYSDRQNSSGLDLADQHELKTLKKQMDSFDKDNWEAHSLINGKVIKNDNTKERFSPSDTKVKIGTVSQANEENIEAALVASQDPAWRNTPIETRARILEKAADLLQDNMSKLLTIICLEGGRSIPDGIAEVREAIEFCRYYALRARCDLPPKELEGPTGESNQLSLHPRGTIACISPWNFPAAIFTGQAVAALAAGNSVITKPAEQTPMTAFEIVKILHEAGVPGSALQLVIGRGSVVGAKLTEDPRVAGVMFTGSTETAKRIEQALANRPGPIGMLIAETGGQNCMIVDSSALPEQTILDITQSAFNSAGQRCSALRVLFVQEDIADSLITMLKGFMAELKVGDPRFISTDIGPVIDQASKEMLQTHFDKMSQQAKLIAQTPLNSSDTQNGHFFAPCAFELNDISLLEGEVFGPFLHVIRYKQNELDKVMDSIIQTGFGLTLGVHSRIDATVQYITSRMPVGNMYVNRNMVGAVVGVQPFGGERLSGTGPKAGGPHYLPHLCVERAISINTTAVGGNARLVSLLEDD